MSDSLTTPLIRVERGRPDDTELAALTAVLLARSATADAEQHEPVRPVALWRRPERAAGFVGPRTWQRAA